MNCSWVTLGLGNPEREYHGTRHNVGIAVMKALYSGMSGGHYELKGRSFAAVSWGDRLLAVQRCYMNESFRIVEEMRTMGIQVDRWLVVHDDLALELGRLKVVRGGQSGGHRGVEGISKALGHQDFARVKVGIAPTWTLDRSLLRDFVLTTFAPEEMSILGPMVQRAASAVSCTLQDGAAKAMDRFNALAIGETDGWTQRA